MSDVMLHGVLNMPPELWDESELDKMQRYSRYLQASRRIEDLTRALEQIRAIIASDSDLPYKQVNQIDKIVGKTLAWADYEKSSRAKTAFGNYEILFSCGVWFISISPTNTADDAEFKTAEQAKAMCQEHWNTLIGSALEGWNG